MIFLVVEVAPVDRKVDVTVIPRREGRPAPHTPVEMSGSDGGTRRLGGQRLGPEVRDSRPKLPREKSSALDLEARQKARLARVAQRPHHGEPPPRIEIGIRKLGPKIVTPRLSIENDARPPQNPVSEAQRSPRLGPAQEIAEAE